MQRLLIADSAEPYAAALADILRGDFEIRVCIDGESALEQLQQFQPDVLIVNLQLPYKDGLTVLQEAAYLPPHILATTSFLSPYVERSAAALGVTYAMLTPSVAAVRVRVMDMVHQEIPGETPVDLLASVTTHLHILNFMTHMDGYHQLQIAIPLFFRDPNQRLTKELYPAVAEICGCTDGRSVEHSVRKAIECAWKARNITVWSKYFPRNNAGDIPCPTNKAFISRIAQALHR